MRSVGLLSLALTLCAEGVTRAADSPWLYGLHWYRTDGDVEAITGGKGVWLLETLMTFDGSWNADSQKSKMEIAASRGHTIICRIQPRWGFAVPHENEMPVYLDAVRATAEKLKHVCRHWQIGNEMNNPIEFGGGNLAPATYVDRFKRIRAAIKEVQSPLGEQVVLLGPPTSFATYYLLGMLINLDPEDVDGIAIHAYGVDPDLAVVNSLANFRAAYAEQLAVIDQEGFRYKPVFITEFDRCTNPTDTAPQENTSSQFLHRAYGELDAWNSNPANHPITTAIWFVYPNDSNWSCFSLLRHKSGPRGQDVNLWDAFQFATTKNYTAGVSPAALDVSTTLIEREFPWQTLPPSDGFTISNIGAGTLNYMLSEDADWLSVSPESGASVGKADAIRITYDFGDRPSAIYEATIDVTATGAALSPATITVRVDLLPHRGDLDRDGDVDQTDFGLFQACLNPPGHVQQDPACRFARLDGDVDVDLNDIGIFTNCMSGPNVPSNPDCGFD